MGWLAGTGWAGRPALELQNCLKIVPKLFPQSNRKCETLLEFGPHGTQKGDYFELQKTSKLATRTAEIRDAILWVLVAPERGRVACNRGLAGWGGLA